MQRKMYPLSPSGVWGSNEKSISEWLRIKGFNLLKIRTLKVFHLDARCTEKYFDILIKQNKGVLPPLQEG
jgi:hypothetical protein